MLTMHYTFAMFQLSPTNPGVKSLRTHLIQLVLAGVIPVLLFAGGLFAYLAHQHKQDVESNLEARVRAIQVAIDEHLHSVVSSLQLLAHAEDFNASELASLHRKLRRATENTPGWVSISLVDLNGKQLLNTYKEFGSPLESYRKEIFFNEVLRTKKPALSDFRIGPDTKQKVLSIAVPIFLYDNLSMVMVGSISIDYLTQILKRQGVKEPWSAAVFSRDFYVIARSVKEDQIVGTKVIPSVEKVIREKGKGIIQDKNQEGIPAIGAFSTSKRSGLTVIMGVPETHFSHFPKIFRLIILSAFCFIGLGVFLALRKGKKIAAPIVALSHSAMEMGKNYTPLAVDSQVEEVQILARSMELASLQRIQSENSIRTLNDISSSLAAELDLKKLLQSFTDQTRFLIRAEVAAYFKLNRTDKGHFDMVTVSGAPMERFQNIPLPGPEGIIRLDNISSDIRFKDVSSGQLELKSYLAVPVLSRTGDVLGAIVFGHTSAGMFSDQDEKLISALTSQAATAIDNASLYSRAREAIEIRDTFLSVASHELKTPLTSIYLQFEILKRSILKSTQDDPKVQNLFDRFASQLERLTRLINELLDVTRIASGKMDLHKEQVDINRLVTDICANFESEALQKNSPITLRNNGPILGQWDSGRIEQVLMNLVSNAIKYGNKKPIEVSVQQIDQMAEVQIKDHGLGIAPEDQSRIFQRFERAIDSNNISGLGLGLFICKEIISRHGGEIQVESSLGEGSTFIVRLPV